MKYRDQTPGPGRPRLGSAPPPERVSITIGTTITHSCEARITAAREPGECLSSFLRLAIERELARRERRR